MAYRSVVKSQITNFMANEEDNFQHMSTKTFFL